MHNIVYYQSKYGMLVCLNYESTHTQISYILYFIKISKLSTIKVQCRLEGIVIKLLPDINQFKDKITSNILPCFLLKKNGDPLIQLFLINCLWYTRGFSDIDCKLNMDG